MESTEIRRFNRLIAHLNQRIQEIVIHNNYYHFRHPCYICVNYLKPEWVRDPICMSCYDGQKFNKWAFDYEWFGEQEPFGI